MRITNNFEMPEVYSRLVTQDLMDYEARRVTDRPSFTVTTLGSPAYKYKLSRKYDADVEIDVADQFLSFRGQMMHKALQDADLCNALHEPRIGMDVDGVWVSGRPDIVLPGKIEDFKMKTVEAYWNPRDAEKDLARQLNPYRFILHDVFNMPISTLTGHLFLMNWVRRRAMYEQGYPNKPHFEINVPVWEYADTEAYLRERIALFCLPLEETPLCTPEERWRHEAVYSVKKEGNKKATKNFTSQEEAVAFKEMLESKTKKGKPTTDKYNIEKKEGEDARCVGYCSPNHFCPYWIEHYSQAVEEPAFDAEMNPLDTDEIEG